MHNNYAVQKLVVKHNNFKLTYKIFFYLYRKDFGTAQEQNGYLGHAQDILCLYLMLC